jgi:hypothetical protein
MKNLALYAIGEALKIIIDELIKMKGNDKNE